MIVYCWITFGTGRQLWYYRGKDCRITHSRTFLFPWHFWLCNFHDQLSLESPVIFLDEICLSQTTLASIPSALCHEFLFLFISGTTTPISPLNSVVSFPVLSIIFQWVLPARDSHIFQTKTKEILIFGDYVGQYVSVPLISGTETSTILMNLQANFEISSFVF